MNSSEMFNIEKNLNFSSNGTDLYIGLYENRTSKIITLVLSPILLTMSALLAYGIIWFEHFGTDNKRTLMNKLISHGLWAVIFQLPIITMSDMVRYIFGPLPKHICFLQVIVKNSLLTQSLIFIDSVMMARYSLIFWVKNPSALNDDFWSRLICIWVYGFSFLINFTRFFLTGYMPMNYYTCSNLDPDKDRFLPKVKLGGFEAGSILFMMIIKVRINQHQKKIAIASNKSEFLVQLEKQSIPDFASCIAAILVFVAYAFLNAKINSMTRQETKNFPNYLLLYFFQLICPIVISCILSLIYYCRHRPLRESVFRELQNFLTFMK